MRSALSSRLCILGKGSTSVLNFGSIRYDIGRRCRDKNITNTMNTTVRKRTKSAIPGFYKNSSLDVFGMYAHEASAEFMRMSTQLREYQSFNVRVCSFVAMNFNSGSLVFAMCLAGGHHRGPTRKVWGVRWTCSTVGCEIRVTVFRFAISIKA